MVSDDELTFVIYSDGTCEELAAAIQSRKDHENDTKQPNIGLTANVTISNSKISILSDGRRCLTFFEQQLNDKTLALVKINLDSGLNVNAVDNVKRFILKRENLDVNVAGYAVIDGDDAPMLLTICKSFQDISISLLFIAWNRHGKKS